MSNKKIQLISFLILFSGVSFANAGTDTCIEKYNAHLKEMTELLLMVPQGDIAALALTTATNATVLFPLNLTSATSNAIPIHRTRTVIAILEQAQIDYGPDLVEFAEDVYGRLANKDEVLKISNIVRNLSGSGKICQGKELANYSDLKMLVLMELR